MEYTIPTHAWFKVVLSGKTYHLFLDTRREYLLDELIEMIKAEYP